MKSAFRYINVFLFCTSAVTLIGLHARPLGWILLAVSALSLALTKKDYAKDMILLHGSLAILGITPITTDISYQHMFVMSSTLIAAVLFPLIVSRYVYKNNRVVFRFHHGRKWYKREVLYIVVTAVIAYFLLPFYLSNTGAYLNWPSNTDFSSIVRLFIGTNGLGVWDELFFVSTVLGILRYHFKFNWANLFQAVLFTSFLYELGFTGWGPLMIFVFAIAQGYIFKKTDSLFYVISIHLTLDFILFLALINAHNPDLANIFVT